MRACVTLNAALLMYNQHLSSPGHVREDGQSQGWWLPGALLGLQRLGHG